MFFSGLFPAFQSPSRAPSNSTPFTTQAEVLHKYGHAPVGMCTPMTAVYVTEALKGKNPSALLEDDHLFVNEAIVQENVELSREEAGMSWAELPFLPFISQGIPHTTVNVPAGQTATELNRSLEKGDHAIMVVPATSYDGRQTKHEVYFGRVPSPSGTTCRFFDANFPGGEKLGSCDTLLAEFAQHLSASTLVDTQPSTIGFASHPSA